MQPKRKPLSAALTHSEIPAEVPAATPAHDPMPTAKPLRQPTTKTRTVQQTVYLPPRVYDQLRKVAFDERVKMHDLLMEGLSLAFERRGLPTVEALSDKKP